MSTATVDHEPRDDAVRGGAGATLGAPVARAQAYRGAGYRAGLPGT